MAIARMPAANDVPVGGLPPLGARGGTGVLVALGDRDLNGPWVALPYCIAPALCEDCYAAAGGLDGIHGDRCRGGAAASQAEAYDIERQLDAGESFAVDADATGTPSCRPAWWA